MTGTPFTPQSFLYFFFLMIRPPPSSTLFPYTTLFRSMLRTHSELGYRQEQRFHLELGLLKLAHVQRLLPVDRKSTRLNSSHVRISYAVFCLKKKKNSVPTTGPLSDPFFEGRLHVAAYL